MGANEKAAATWHPGKAPDAAVVSRTVTTCATGCRVRGEHLASCVGRCYGCTRSVEVAHTKACTDRAEKARGDRLGDTLDVHRPCTGCVPRLAEPGSRLCAWCEQRLAADVATAPALVRHLLVMAEPDAGAKAPADGYTSGGDPSEGSVLSPAVNDADTLHALLAEYAALWLDEHPGSAGPDETHAVRSKQTIRHTEHGDYVRRSSVAGIRNAKATEDLVEWLLPRLPWLAAKPWAGEIRAELGQLVATLHARWPMDDTRERAIPGTPCPRCEQINLTYTPTAWFRAPFKVACQNPECGRIFTEDEWASFVALATKRSKR